MAIFTLFVYSGKKSLLPKLNIFYIVEYSFSGKKPFYVFLCPIRFEETTLFWGPEKSRVELQICGIYSWKVHHNFYFCFSFLV